MGTLGVFFERPASEKRTATAGWYNSAAFHQAAEAEELPAWSLNGDAFSDAVKQQVIERLRAEGRQADLVVYSLASPVRVHPETGETIRSTLKPIGAPFTGKTVDLDRETVTEATIEPGSEDEIGGTVAVMGGDDLRRWVDALLGAGTLAPGARVVAYSYIGPKLTWPIYRSGTIGRAKEDLEAAARELDGRLKKEIGGRAWVAVNKAVVTQASAAIPVVPLYISLLYRVMQDAGLHERPIEQMVRLFNDHLADGREPALDEAARIRMDDWEMREDIQAEVARRWERVTTENLADLADFALFKREFRRLFGFEVDGVDYNRPVDTEAPLPA
jgi:enoyl-[acyl-carrier protein] reductase/trans-2-enoyl-CoA reductase (NAD+)